MRCPRIDVYVMPSTRIKIYESSGKRRVIYDPVDAHIVGLKELSLSE